MCFDTYWSKKVFWLIIGGLLCALILLTAEEWGFKHSLSSKSKFTWKISEERRPEKKLCLMLGIMQIMLTPAFGKRLSQFVQGGPFIRRSKTTFKHILQNQVLMVMIMMDMIVMTSSLIHVRYKFCTDTGFRKEILPLTN